MRVLVTGGAGFVGSHLCERLIKDGHEVIALDSLVTGKLSNLDHLIDHPRMSFVQCFLLHICQCSFCRSEFLAVLDKQLIFLCNSSLPLDHLLSDRFFTFINLSILFSSGSSVEHDNRTNSRTQTLLTCTTKCVALKMWM